MNLKNKNKYFYRNFIYQYFKYKNMLYISVGNYYNNEKLIWNQFKVRIKSNSYDL